MFCPKCGNSVPDGQSFCNNCGTPVQNAPTTQGIHIRNIPIGGDGTKWVVVLLLAVIVFAPLYPLISVPLVDAIGSIFSPMSGSGSLSSFSYAQFWLFFERPIIDELADYSLFFIILFMRERFLPLYICASLLSLCFIILMIKNLITEEANSDKFWKYCMSSGFVLGISNIVMPLYILFINLTVNIALSEALVKSFGYKNNAIYGFQLFKASFLCALFAIIGIGIGIYARYQRKLFHQWRSHQSRNPQNTLQ